MKKINVFIFLIACMCLSACSVERSQISVTTYPIQYMSERLVGNQISVYNISKSKAIQTASIKEECDAVLKDSSVLFYVSDLEPYLDVYGDRIKESGVEMANVLDYSTKNKFERITYTMVDNNATFTNSPYYGESGFENIDLYENDPMIWLDPISFISSVEMMRDKLISLYPNLSDLLNENYQAIELELTKLDASYQVLKKTKKPIAFVSMTPSFGYWQKAYGVRVYPVCLSKYGALPSNEQLHIIKNKIREDGVKYIAHEPNLNEDMEALFLQLESELGLERIELNNVSSITKEQKDMEKDYFTLMYENLTELQSIME